MNSLLPSTLISINDQHQDGQVGQGGYGSNDQHQDQYGHHDHGNGSEGYGQPGDNGSLDGGQQHHQQQQQQQLQQAGDAGGDLMNQGPPPPPPPRGKKLALACHFCRRRKLK